MLQVGTLGVVGGGGVNTKASISSLDTEIKMILPRVCSYFGGSYESYYLKMLICLVEQKEVV